MTIHEVNGYKSDCDVMHDYVIFVTLVPHVNDFQNARDLQTLLNAVENIYLYSQEYRIRTVFTENVAGYPNLYQATQEYCIESFPIFTGIQYGSQVEFTGIQV